MTIDEMLAVLHAAKEGKAIESIMLTYSPESIDNVDQDSFDFGSQEKDGDN